MPSFVSTVRASSSPRSPARSAIAKDRAAAIGFTGTINGGTAKVDGVVDLTRPAEPRGSITLSAQDVAFEYPEGLQTESNARLTLTLAATGPTLAGRIDVLGGVYREPLVVSSRLLRAGAGGHRHRRRLRRLSLRAASRSDAGDDGGDSHRQQLRAARDLRARFRIIGTPERPGVIGRIEAAPDGEIFLAGNTYRIERLVLDFADPRAIAPDLTFLAQTRVGSTPIEVELQCPARRRLRAAGEVARVGRHRR